MRSILTAAALGGALALNGAVGNAQSPAINVVVNEVPVAFTDAPPQELNNSVVVPLRGVFEQLGASVNYDSATKRIQSQKGQIIVVLTIGQSTAFVNGNPQTLAQPPVVIQGTTLVPLRFVAQSFGADVEWLPATQTVEIKTVDQHVGSLPLPPVNSDGEAIGTLTGVFPNTNPPHLTMRVQGNNCAVPFSDQTVILVQRGHAPATQSGLRDIHVGDQVRVTILGSSGIASAVRVVYGIIEGTVKSIGTLSDGTHIVTLNDGQSIAVASDAIIAMAGRRIHMSDIMPNDHVILQTRPDDNKAYYVTVPAHLDNGPGRPGPGTGGPFPRGHASIDSFTVNAHGPIRADDMIQAALRGTPGRKSNVSVLGVADTLPMHETSSSSR